jgi:hypothetical protein
MKDPNVGWTIVTDASPYAMGAHLKYQGKIIDSLSQSFSMNEALKLTHNVQEALGVLKALEYWKNQIPIEIPLTIQQDNVAVIQSLKKTISNVDSLNVWIEKIMMLSWQMNWEIQPIYLPADQLTEVDYLSRRISHKTLTVSMKVHTLISPFTVDMFAEKENAIVKNYVARWPDSEAVAIDALSCNWIPLVNKYGQLWINPPWRLWTYVKTLIQLWVERAKVLKQPMKILMALPWTPHRFYWLRKWIENNQIIDWIPKEQNPWCVFQKGTLTPLRNQPDCILLALKI